MGVTLSSNISQDLTTSLVDIPNEHRYINSFQRACTTCDKEFLENAKIAIKAKYKQQSKTEIDKLFDEANFDKTQETIPILKKKYKKYYEETKLIAFLQDAYAQNMFECYVADILRRKPFDQARKAIKQLEPVKQIQLEQRINEFETKFNRYVANVIENRRFSDIKGSTISIPIQKPQDWTHAFANLKVILTQMTNGLQSNIT